MTKICTKCKLMLPLYSFHKNRHTKDGFQHKCKDCIKKYHRNVRLSALPKKSPELRGTEFNSRRDEYLSAFIYDEIKQLKTCGRCKKVRSFSDFNARRAKSGPKIQSYCKQCITERGREYRAKKTVLYNKVTMDWYIELKEQGCTDCGQIYPHYCNDWDHLPDYPKAKGISALLTEGASKELVLDEIAKCQLVCAVCHRKRTWARYDNQRQQNPLLNEIKEGALLLD